MRRKRAAAEEAILTISSVGARGDGVAEHGGQKLYVPLTAPGDRVRARLGEKRGEGRAAELVEVLEKGARAPPPCPHFGRCGGCALQHLAAAAYVEAKEAQVRAALRQHALGSVVAEPLIRIPPGTRRRARFAVERPRGGGPAVVGFNARASHRIVDLDSCLVLDPALVRLAEALRAAAGTLWPKGAKGAATATVAETGIELLLDLADAPDLAGLEALAAFAAGQDLDRLAWRAPGVSEPVPAAIKRNPFVLLSGVAVELPPDAFLQASAEAEAALVAEVLGGAPQGAPIADLHAGLGTFSLALIRQGSTVHAVDGARAAIATLDAAARRSGLHRLTTECRDLEARPLLAEELKRFEAVVFDPPRAGAAAQAAEIARSRVVRVVAVSCNPASFARDARLLVEGGFRLERVQPIDQFVWSPHVELVARFAR